MSRKTALERDAGLVRAELSEWHFGGITLGQWQRVKRTSGVDVAAPVANLGYVIVFEKAQRYLDHYVNHERRQVFRVRRSWLSYNGHSRYPDQYSASYVYVTLYGRKSARFTTASPADPLIPIEGGA